MAPIKEDNGEGSEEEKNEEESEGEKSEKENLPEEAPEWEYEFRTIGKSKFGLLGQGNDTKESKKFKRVEFDIKINSVEEVSLGSKHIIVRVNNRAD